MGHVPAHARAVHRVRVRVRASVRIVAEHHAAETVQEPHLETAEGAELLVPEIAVQHVPVNAKMTVTKHVRALALGHAIIHVLTVAQVGVIIHVRGLVLVDARIHARAVEALALTIVPDVLAAVLVVVLVPVAPHAQEPVQDVTDVVTNALPHVSSPAPDVPGAVPAVHRAVQAVNPLVVTLVPERAVMAALTHAVRVALPVQRIVLQTAERLARAHATEA